MSLDRQPLCCPRHLSELCSFLKSQVRNHESHVVQGRHNEAGDAVISFFRSQGGLGQLQASDQTSRRTIFLVCMEHAARFTVAGSMDKVAAVLECGQ